MVIKNECLLKVLRLNWLVISLVFFTIASVELAWVKANGVSNIHYYLLYFLPVPFVFFTGSAFMLTLNSFINRRTIIRGIQLFFGVITFLLSVITLVIWISR